MKILVIAAHPDDEILGCGGTIARHSAAGDEVHVVILAEGLSARTEGKAPATELTKLHRTAQEANALLGVRSVTVHDFPDNRLDSLDRLEVIKVVENFLKKFEPELVYTHHHGDANVDHRRIHEAVMTAARPQPGQKLKTILFFEVPSSTGWQAPLPSLAFVPNWFEDISVTLPKKLAALKVYEAEMRAWPHARSYEAVDALARWRGASVGREAAEAFVLGRRLG